MSVAEKQMPRGTAATARDANTTKQKSNAMKQPYKQTDSRTQENRKHGVELPKKQQAHSPGFSMLASNQKTYSFVGFVKFHTLAKILKMFC